MEKLKPTRSFEELYTFAKRSNNNDSSSAGDSMCMAGNGQQERSEKGARRGYLQLYDGLKNNKSIICEFLSQEPHKTEFMNLKLDNLDKGDKELIWYKFTRGELNELFDFQDFKNSNGNNYPSQRWHFIVSYCDWNAAANERKCSFIICEELKAYVLELEQQMILEE